MKEIQEVQIASAAILKTEIRNFTIWEFWVYSNVIICKNIMFIQWCQLA